MYTTFKSTASNEQAFSKLEIIKMYVKSIITTFKYLQNIMLLNSNKDILDNYHVKLINVNIACLLYSL